MLSLIEVPYWDPLLVSQWVKVPYVETHSGSRRPVVLSPCMQSLELLQHIKRFSLRITCDADQTLYTVFIRLFCILGNFSCFCCLLTLLISSKRSFRNAISVKCFGSRSGPTFCWCLYGSKLLANVMSR